MNSPEEIRVIVAETINALNQEQVPLTQRWLRPPQAAAYTGLSENHLADLRRLREGPAHSRPSPNVISYDVRELDAYMASKAVRP